MVNQALKVDGTHTKSVYRKGKCLTYLFMFDEAKLIFKKLEQQDDVEMVNVISEQREGNYDRLRKNFKVAQALFKQGKVINYICPKIYVKMTQDKGRGFFA